MRYLSIAAVLFLTLSISAAALAGSPIYAKRAPKEKLTGPKRAIHRAVIRPLNAAFQERYMFSRARVRPQIRKIETFAATEDPSGRSFVGYKIRTVRGRHENLSGCYYPGEDAVYLNLDDGFVLASQHPKIAKKRKKQQRQVQEASADPTRCVANPNEAISMVN